MHGNMNVKFNFIMSFTLSAWNNSAAIEWIFMKFDYFSIFLNLSNKIQFSLKSDKNNKYLT